MPATQTPPNAPNAQVGNPPTEPVETPEVLGVNEHEFFDEPEEVAQVPAPAPATVVPPPPPVPTKHTHPRWIERAAIEQGMTDEEIESTPPDALMQKVYNAQQKKVAEWRQSSTVADVNAAKRPQPGQPAVPEVPQPAPTLAAPQLADLDPEVWPAEFVEQWKAMKSIVKSQEETIAQLKQTAGQFHQSQQQSVQQRVDGFVGKFPQVYFPNGSIDTIRYQALWSALNNMPQGERTTLENDVQRIHTALFGAIAPPASPPPPPAPAVDPSRQDLADAYRNGGVNRPTQRNTTPLPKGVKSAVLAVQKLMQEQPNGDGIHHDDDPLDGLPG